MHRHLIIYFSRTKQSQLSGKKNWQKKLYHFFEVLYSSVSVGNCVNQAEFWIPITVFKF